MTRRRLLALAILAVAACSTQPTIGSRFNGPSAAIAFRGFSRKDAGTIRAYVAVASSRGDEIRLIDPDDVQPVVGPGSVFPLSIPTAPRPLLLASASLRDQDAGGNPLDLPDVLVAASAGGAGIEGAGPSLQLIETWDQRNRVADDVPLGLAAGAEILCLAGVPARAATGTLPAANARILVGAREGIGVGSGKLVVVEFTRAQDGSGAVVLGPPAVKSLDFDPVDIAVSPEGAAVYIATPDAIATDATLGTVFGVARVDASGDVVSGAVSALAAGPRDPDSVTPGPPRTGAGTIAVAAASGVLERTVDTNVQNSADQFTSPTSYVYAALDPASCGRDKAIDCGIVTIDPASTASTAAGNLARDLADPQVHPNLALDNHPVAPTHAEAQPYRAPVPIPGAPLHIALGGPPASGSERKTDDPNNPGLPLLRIAPGSGERRTAAVAMVSSSDGRVYWVDLSRSAPPSDLPVARGGVSVTSAASSTVDAGANRLGLWQDAEPFGSTGFTPTLRVDSNGLVAAIDVWPGFTDSDTWNLVYQGELSFLSSRQGLLASDGAGTTYAGFQTSTGVLTARIADPSLGVRPGDIVELPGVCEARVAAVIPETPALVVAGVSFVGGAVQLSLDAASGATCTAAQLPAANTVSPATLTVRASGLVLSNTKLGYLGRPEIARTADPAENAFSVAWTSASDGSASAKNEARALARKARRLFYPSDRPCPITENPVNEEQTQKTGCFGTTRKRITDPLAPGPIIRFRVGVVAANASDPNPVPPRGAFIRFATSAGLSQSSRKPTVNGAGAGAPIPFDRTGMPGHPNDPIFFFVPYLDDQVMMFSPTQSSVTNIR